MEENKNLGDYYNNIKYMSIYELDDLLEMSRCSDLKREETGNEPALMEVFKAVIKLSFKLRIICN